MLWYAYDFLSSTYSTYHCVVLLRLNVNPDIFAKVSSDPSCGKIHRVTTKNWRQHLMTSSVYTYTYDNTTKNRHTKKNSLRDFF